MLRYLCSAGMRANAARLFVVLLSCLLLAHCGGGGGGGAPPVPTVSLVASPAPVSNGSSSTLIWSSTDATTCTASGAWSGAKATSGSEPTGILHATPANFSLSCIGPGGTASATANVKVLGVFPIRVEANKHYLVDAEGNPFLLQGDAAWDLITQLTKQEAADYLENRRQKGFNAVIVRLIDHFFTPGHPNNADGNPPFTSCDINTHICDFSTTNDVYFDHADWVINKAAEKGILVLLAPVYTGFDGLNEGWFQEMENSTTVKLQGYGSYVGNRYKNFTNILWVNGGDFSPRDAAGMDLVRKVAEGISGAMPGALQTFHGGRHTPALGFWGMSEAWLTVNDIYTDENDVFAMALAEYNRSTMPFFMIENRYENEPRNPTPPATPANAALVRTQAYQAMLSGATGYFMGNFPIWDFDTGWQAELNIGAATNLKHLRNLFEARAWHTLQPDLNNQLLTGGIGVDKDRAVAASAGTFAIAYVPAVRQITIDPSQLSGPNVQAKWCDPTNGVCTAAGAPFAKNSGSKNFTPVGNNSGGFGDWVLLLESIP